MYCPDQLGPAVHRLIPPGLDQVTYPTFGSPAFVDWVDYNARLAEADPQAFAREALARAGTHTLWFVTSPGYITHPVVCQTLSTLFTVARRREVRIGPDEASSSIPASRSSRPALRRAADRGADLAEVARLTTDARARCSFRTCCRVGIVLLALVLTRHVLRGEVGHATPDPGAHGPARLGRGLVPRHRAAGYGGVAKVGLRFFPLFPLIARAVSWLPGVSAGAAVLLVANLSALAVGCSLYELASGVKERDHDLARRAVWIVYLAPTAFVLVMGYAEATLMTATLVALLALARPAVVARGRGGRRRGPDPSGRVDPRGPGPVRGVAGAGAS